MKKKIYIRVTDGCNMHCNHCYVNVNYSDPQFINPYKCIDYIKDYINKTNADEYNISFTGGEPFYTQECFNIVNKIYCAIKDYNGKKIYFDATTNLMQSTRGIDSLINLLKNNTFLYNNRPFIKISYDFGYMRFKDSVDLSLWENNLKKLLANIPNLYIKVNICMTTILLSTSPKTVLNKMEKYGVSEIHFERLTANTTKVQSLIPSYSDIDNWLVLFYKYYKASGSEVVIEMFNNYKYAVKGYLEGCAKRECMSNVITINPDMSIAGCPNTYNFTGELNIAELAKAEHRKNELCLVCEYYQMCNGDCFQLAWQGLRCPAPIKLMNEIRKDFIREHNGAIKEDIYCYEYLEKQREIADLLNDYDDTNLIYMEDYDTDIADMVISFFNTESRLIYPAKSYFVAIVYAACINKLYGKDIKRSLDWPKLLNRDIHFKRYSEDPNMYDKILDSIDDPLSYNASKKTINYFIQEFLLDKDKANILLGE